MNFTLTGRQVRNYTFITWAITACFVVLALGLAWLLEAAWIAAGAFILGKVIVVIAGAILFRAWRRGRRERLQNATASA